jgi:hypothetical protein
MYEFELSAKQGGFDGEWWNFLVGSGEGSKLGNGSGSSVMMSLPLNIEH